MRDSPEPRPRRSVFHRVIGLVIHRPRLRSYRGVTTSERFGRLCVKRTIGLDELYWGTSLTVQEICDRLDLSADPRTAYDLWRWVAPVEAGAMCPYCGADLLFRNRQRRKDGRAECERCRHDTGMGSACNCHGCIEERAAIDRAERETAREAFALWDDSYDTAAHLALVWDQIPTQTQTIFRVLRSLLSQTGTVTWPEVAAAASRTTAVVDNAIEDLRLAQLIRVNPDDGQYRVNMHVIPVPKSLGQWSPPRPYGRYKSIDPLAALLDNDDGLRSDDDNWSLLCLLDDRFDQLMQRTRAATSTPGFDATRLWYGADHRSGVSVELDDLLDDIIERHGGAMENLRDCAHRVLRASLRAQDVDLGD